MTQLLQLWWAHKCVVTSHLCTHTHSGCSGDTTTVLYLNATLGGSLHKQRVAHEHRQCGAALCYQPLCQCPLAHITMQQDEPGSNEHAHWVTCTLT